MGTKKVKKEKITLTKNEGKLAASICRQVAAWFPDMFCNFYLVKNHSIDENKWSKEGIVENYTVKNLPVSANRWQHGSQICFATFI